MTVNITVPDDLWDGDTEAVVTAWLTNDNAMVKKGALIAEIMVEKSQLEIHAPASGILKIVQNVDAVVNKGAVIGTIDESA